MGKRRGGRRRDPVALLDLAAAANATSAAALRLLGQPDPEIRHLATQLACAVALVLDGAPRIAQVLALAAVLLRQAEEMREVAFPVYPREQAVKR